MLNSFLQKISNFIESTQLLEHNAKYLVALSGGADSVALLCALQTLGYDISAAHCNFHLRGAESDRDELFCQELCKTKNIRFHRAHFDTKAYANQHHVSIEMAARELRYSYFHRLINQFRYDGVCVAHHRDDNAETILLNIIRGTGINGLVGIQPRNGKVLRPLLCVGRNEITKYLDFIGQQHVDDSTNFHADVKRNKLRLEIIPLLKTLNPSIVDSLMQLSYNAQNAKVFLDERLENLRYNALLTNSETHCVYKLEPLRHYEHLTFHILSDYGFTPVQTTQIYQKLDAQTGTEWHSPTHVALIDRDTLIIYTRESVPSESLTMPIEAKYNYEELLTISIASEERTPQSVISRSKNVATVDAETVKYPLSLRPVKQGDAFIPYGMKGRKLISDYLTDRKRSLYDKRCQLVITDATGKTIWLVGERTDNRCSITHKTKRILTITIGYNT